MARDMILRGGSLSLSAVLLLACAAGVWAQATRPQTGQGGQAGADRRFIAVLAVQPADAASAAAAAKVTDSLRLKLHRQIRRLAGDARGETNLVFVSGRETDDALGDLAGLIDFRADAADAAGLASAARTAGLLRERLAAHVGVVGRLRVEDKGLLVLDLAVVDLTISTDAWHWTQRFTGEGERAVALVTDGPVEAITRTPLWRPREENAVPEPAVLAAAINANADMEEGAVHAASGDRHPAHWQRGDGLCSFWEAGIGVEGGHGVRLFTDVPQSQADDWWARWRAGASAAEAPTALPTRGRPDYASVAGIHGVHWHSDPFAAAAGVQHRVIAFHRSETGSSKVFVKGYRMMQGVREREATPREIWRQWQSVKSDGPRWTRRSETFTPMAGVEQIKIIAYSYWPQGEYFHDRLSVHPEPAAPDLRPGPPPED